MMNIGINAPIVALCCLIGLNYNSLATTPILSEYSASNKIWIAAAEGKVSPLELETYVSAADTNIMLKANDGDMLVKGAHWATIDPEDLELKERSLKLKRKQTNLALDQVEFKIQEDLKSLNEKIISLQNKVRQLKRILASDNLSKSLKSKCESTIELSYEKIKRLEELISTEHIELIEEVEREDLKIQLLTAEKAYKKQYEKSVLLAPFDGEINLSNLKELQRDDDPSLHELRAGDLYATIADDSDYIVTIDKDLPIFSISDKNKICIKFEAGTRSKLIEGSYLSEKSKAYNGGIFKSYTFIIDTEFKELARSFSGQSRTILIYYNLGKQCYIVPKSDLALLAPKILKSSGWRGVVKKLYPDAALVLAGSETLAISIVNDGN
jgi:hypothetical protein